MLMKTDTQTNMPGETSSLDRVLRILHLEDSPEDRAMIQRCLREQELAAEFTDVDNEAGFVQALTHGAFDIILSDKSLPDFDGLSALRHVRVVCPHVPFIFVSGSMGEEAAIETMRDGAADYVLKNRLSRLFPAVVRAVRESEQKAKNRKVEERNREQAALLDESQDAILVIDTEDRIHYWNKSAERIYGWPAHSVIGSKANTLLPTDPVKYREAKEIVLKKGKWMGELASVNGRDDFIVASRWTLLRDEAGNPKRILITDTDITEKKTLEATLLRSQRMEGIGALASGVAHDLNNALAPVIMSADILEASPEKEDRDKFLEIIRASAHRATGLVKQILTFARGTGDRRGPVLLTQLIAEMSKMIKDTFPKSITLSVKTPGKELWIVEASVTEIHQVLLNLCVNARDAMPEGGTILLSVENFTLDEGATTAAGVAPGRYVKLSLADTGSGIPPEVLPRIFEPFFTTKAENKGTGLGLSTVASIVKHHGGFIDVQTQTGKGTEFRIYLPAICEAQPEEVAPAEVTLPTGHGELILAIDDDETVLELTKTTLESYGYKVVTARNGLQGLARFKENQDNIRLLVTDTDMPHMDGLAAVRAIKELKPDVPVIVASGSRRMQTELVEIDRLHLHDLGKPYSLEQLLIAVDQGLDG